jgi:simple sugar transport system permease protein
VSIPGLVGLLARRLASTAGRTIAAPVVSILVSLGLVGLLLLYIKASPLTAFLALAQGGLGNLYSIGITVVRGVPLIFAGLSVAIAFRAGLFNIGAEGQLQMGALAGTLVALQTGSLWLALLLGTAAGAATGALVGVLKAARGVNEIITTIMLNFIAIEVVNHIVSGPFMERDAPHPATPAVALTARLLPIVPGTRIHAGAVLAVLAAMGAHALLTRTPLGFRLRAVGANPEAAAHAGIRVDASLAWAASSRSSGSSTGWETSGPRAGGFRGSPWPSWPAAIPWA